MKQLSTIAAIVLIVLIGTAIMYAQTSAAENTPTPPPTQTAPILTAEQKFPMLELLNQQHKIFEQMQSIKIDLQDKMTKAAQDFDKLQQQLNSLQKQIEAAGAALPFDHSKFALDYDSLAIKPIPAQTAAVPQKRIPETAPSTQ